MRNSHHISLTHRIGAPCHLISRGKRVLVTGGSGGIGSAVVRALSRAGAYIAVNYVGNADAAKVLVNEIGPERRRVFPGDDEDTDSRYIEATVDGMVPLPAQRQSGASAILAGDFSVMPTDLDIYAPECWTDDALFRPEVREAYRKLIVRDWTDALRMLYLNQRIYTFWKYFRDAFRRDAGLRIDHLLLSPAIAKRLKAAGVDRNIRG